MKRPGEGKGGEPTTGLYYGSPLDDERPVMDQVYAVAVRLEPARADLVALRQRFQSHQSQGTIRLTIFAFAPTNSIEFLLDVEDVAFLANICPRPSASSDRHPKLPPLITFGLIGYASTPGVGGRETRAL